MTLDSQIIDLQQQISHLMTFRAKQILSIFNHFEESYQLLKPLRAFPFRDEEMYFKMTFLDTRRFVLILNYDNHITIDVSKNKNVIKNVVFDKIVVTPLSRHLHLAESNQNTRYPVKSKKVYDLCLALIDTYFRDVFDDQLKRAQTDELGRLQVVLDELLWTIF